MPVNSLVLNRYTHRFIVNRHIYHLIFTSFAKTRFAAQTRLLSEHGRLFLNYGYEEDPPMGLRLDPADEPDRYFVQQYHRTATQTDIAGKRVLEVSCGHGGGAAYLAKTLKPAAYTGLDLNDTAIEFCRSRYQAPELDFVVGDAGNLPFADESFDVVLNVEASHLYPDVPAFLAEASRVLTADGRFLYTDFIRREDLPKWEATLAAAPLEVESCVDVTREVLRGNECNVPHKRGLVRDQGPLVRFANDATDWAFNEALRNGDFVYRMYSFRKKPTRN